MANKKKLLTTAIALGTAAALTLGGTFAWQSISQTALNEASDIINPGGRLHNDQNWVSAKMNNTDIYVENFTDPDKGGNDIFARVRLSEYMEIVMNYGVDGAEVVDVIAGEKTPTGSYAEDDATRKNEFDYKYAVHYFDAENKTDDWWNWNEGKADSETVYYMPTFNKNKDSLLADLNGTYVDAVGGISNRKAEQYKYEAITAETPAKTAYAIYDGDVNTADEIGRDDLLDLIANGTDAANYEAKKDHIALTSEEHEVAKVGTTKQLISMAEWLEMVGDNYDKATYGSYWVYDTDGWVYWSAPIAAGETTGLLLDSIELKQVMDDTWYYAINVEAQFVTADDVGKDDGTGFYTVLNTVTPAAEDGEETVTEQPITAEAEKLLKLIGVQFDDETAGGEGNGDTETQNPVTIYAEASPNWYSKSCSVMEPVTLTASGLYFCLDPYEYTPFDSEILADTQWELSGNTSEGTTLSATTGEEVILTISTDETGELEVKATITYNGYTNSGTTTITSEPHVASIDLFDTDVENPVQHSLQVKYTAGTSKTYELAMFPKYTGGIYPYDTRITGEPQKKLAEAVTFTLADANHNDGATIEGVTISQSTEDKTMLTVTIAEGVTEKFSIHCEASGIQGYADFKPADVTPPTVSVEKAVSGDNNYTLTVSGLTEEDHEMAINFYELASATQDYSEGTNTYSGTLCYYGSSFWGNISEAAAGACSVELSNMSYDAGTATMTVTVTNSGTTDCYLDISVADNSDNVGKIAAPVKIDGVKLTLTATAYTAETIDLAETRDVDFTFTATLNGEPMTDADHLRVYMFRDGEDVGYTGTAEWLKVDEDGRITVEDYDNAWYIIRFGSAVYGFEVAYGDYPEDADFQEKARSERLTMTVSVSQIDMEDVPQYQSYSDEWFKGLERVTWSKANGAVFLNTRYGDPLNGRSVDNSAKDMLQVMTEDLQVIDMTLSEKGTDYEIYDLADGAGQVKFDYKLKATAFIPGNVGTYAIKYNVPQDSYTQYLQLTVTE